MGKSWAEFRDAVRRDLYKLNMELQYWIAMDDKIAIQDIEMLIEANQRILDAEQMPTG